MPDLAVSAPSAGVSNVCEVESVPLLVRNEECMHEMHPAYCKQSKTGQWESLGMMLVGTHARLAHLLSSPMYN